MLSQLIFANLHFGTNIFGALVFFLTGWLYLDSWKIAKETKSDLVRSIGLFLLALISIVHASTLNVPALNLVMQIIKITSLCLIAGSLAVEPIIQTPKKVAVVFPFILLTDSLVPLSAALFFIIAFLYLRKSTEGVAREIKPAALGFFLLALAELISTAFAASGTTFVAWSKLLAQYGLFWNASHFLELAGVGILGLWTWGYLRFRADFQLFITTVSTSLVVFIVTTSAFTFLLLKNQEEDALAQLKTNVGVMQYALERLKLEALANAKAITKNTGIQDAFLQGENEKLFDLTSEFMLAQETSFLTVASSSGEVVVRAEDREKTGDTLSENPLFKSAIGGIPQVAVEVKQGAIVPAVEISAADSFPGATGVVLTGFSVNNAFADGVKATTGLDTSVYSGDVRTATTFIAPDGKSRFIGTKETNAKILSTVLEKGEIYTGLTKILNQPFYTAYAPLKNIEDKTIGMLFVGRPQKELITTSQKSTQLTFTASALLILLSIGPAYYLARYIKGNIKA